MWVHKNATDDTTTSVEVMVLGNKILTWGNVHQVPRRRHAALPGQNDLTIFFQHHRYFETWFNIVSHEWYAIAETRSGTSCDRIISRVNLFLIICNIYQVHTFSHSVDILHSSTSPDIWARRALRALPRTLHQFVFWFAKHQRNLFIKTPQRLRCNKHEYHRSLEAYFVLHSFVIEVHC